MSYKKVFFLTASLLIISPVFYISYYQQKNPIPLVGDTLKVVFESPLKMNPFIEYSPGFILDPDSIDFKSISEIHFEIEIKSDKEIEHAMQVCSVTRQDTIHLNWQKKDIEIKAKPSHKQTGHFWFPPGTIHGADKISLFIWNLKKEEFEIISLKTWCNTNPL